MQDSVTTESLKIIRIAEPLHRRMKIVAVKSGRSLTDVTEEAARMYLDRVEKSE